MNEDAFDELLSRLMEFFPQVNDLELLTEAILQSECSLDLAIDYILAHSFGQGSDGTVPLSSAFSKSFGE